MTMRALQIFSAGTWNSMAGPVTVDRSAVSQIATSYNRLLRPALLVLGHPQVEMDSYGTVHSLANVDGELYAFADVDEGLVDAVRGGRYKSVSASIYRPEDHGNPVPGSYYLKHVGLLGAVPPAVRNMQPLSFAESVISEHPGGMSFSVPIGCVVDQSQMRTYALARDIQHANPDISFIHAAQIVESAMRR
ncbi:hypothetical protein [Stenotrophomonas maltophilia]|uniref:hypothetical protein n=1 Tax=Stenotrophomonas maltophilia TaxID=40324 RepID=UPI001952F90B|nr:hypothetical protein [Stenotrophomonas maltophilia]